MSASVAREDRIAKAAREFSRGQRDKIRALGERCFRRQLDLVAGRAARGLLLRSQRDFPFVLDYMTKGHIHLITYLYCGV